jgi:hypothetical protein
MAARRKSKKSSSRTAKKAWTLAVYMAGDNSLDSSAYDDLSELKKVGSTPNIHVIAQVDSASAGHQTTRYALTKGPRSSLTNDAVQQLGNQNTGDPRALIAFIDWVASNYPAKRYALVLWNHGQGWDDTDIYAGTRARGVRRPRRGGVKRALFHTSVKKAGRAMAIGGRELLARAILLDDNSKDFLDNLEMKKVMQAAVRKLGGPIDLLGMDACLMNQVEVAYQVRTQASFLVGSELTEPAEGWPYQKVLGALAKRPSMSSADFAKTIVDAYVASYRGSGQEVTQSAVTLARVGAVDRAIDALARAMTTALTNDGARREIKLARVDTLQFDDNLESNVDLRDFCDQLRSGNAPATVKKAAGAVTKALDAYVVRAGHVGNGMKSANGVAIYFPQRAVDLSPLYRTNLDFAKRNAWSRFLAAFVR